MSFYDFLAFNDIAIAYETLPKGIDAFTFKDDGYCYIVVSNRLTGTALKEAVRHEIQHIIEGHLWSYDVVACEKRVQDQPVKYF